jgi:hypothetical protein
MWGLGAWGSWPAALGRLGRHQNELAAAHDDAGARGEPGVLGREEQRCGANEALPSY